MCSIRNAWGIFPGSCCLLHAPCLHAAAAWGWTPKNRAAGSETWDEPGNRGCSSQSAFFLCIWTLPHALWMQIQAAWSRLASPAEQRCLWLVLAHGARLGFTPDVRFGDDSNLQHGALSKGLGAEKALPAVGSPPWWWGPGVAALQSPPGISFYPNLG